jgi:hypothetical protein
VDTGERQVIGLRLDRIEDMFELPQSDLFSEYRNFLTGVDYCISELRSRRSRGPLRIEITLPASELRSDLAERVRRTLQRYCDHRMRYNRRERRAVRTDGASALRVGLPVAALGLAVTAFATSLANGGTAHLITDHLGWVLAWIGLWFPLDELLFSPLAYGRENRVLALLHDADIVIGPHATTPAELGD